MEENEADTAGTQTQLHHLGVLIRCRDCSEMQQGTVGEALDLSVGSGREG